MVYWWSRTFVSAPQQALLIGGGFDPNKDPFWNKVEALISFAPISQGYYQAALYGSDQGWAAMTRRMVYTGVSSELRTEFWKSPTASGPYYYYQYDDNQFLWYNTVFDNSRITKTTTSAFGWTQGTSVAATLVKIPLDLLSKPGIVATNITLHDIHILASNGTDLYAVGSISGFNSPNQVYKSTNDGLTWTALGTLSGTTFPYDIGGPTSPSGQAMFRVGQRWFLIFGQNGLNIPATTCRVFYTDNTDPVDGWQPTVGLEVPNGATFNNVSQVIGFDGQRYYIGKYYQNTGEIFSSTDRGNTWTSEYTIPAGFNQARLWGIEATGLTPGVDKVRAIAGGEYPLNATIYEKVIGTNTWISFSTGMTGARTGYYNISNVLSPGWNQFDWASVPWSKPSAGTTSGQAIAYANTQDNTGNTWQVRSTTTGIYTAVSGLDIPLVETGTPNIKSLTLPLNGTAYVDTTNYKWAGGSLKTTNGPAQIITTQGNDFDFGSQDWTIEFWLRSDIGNQTSTLLNKINVLTGVGPFNFMLENNNISFYCFNNTSNLIIDWNRITPVPTTTWNFIAAQRSGDIITIYLNGINIRSQTLTAGTVLYNDSSPINIGAYADSAVFFNGWFDDIRITKGIARYSGDFTPPQNPFPNE